MKRKCWNCKNEKTISFFPPNQWKKPGAPICTKCAKERNAKYQIKLAGAAARTGRWARAVYGKNATQQYLS